ncbi:hypothetical protein [Bradyrhizobium sp. CCBAU 51745]|uniref:hypothetical protein n=1 Tax=Bradyrhizobium sp. CCBAU 51745 TaxID=1325099 RepID=UPI00230549DF|nr:hypothetical protein [Bradyrhizobium sp. CCBAU 51745]
MRLVPAPSKRAEAAIAANPTKSDRAIAAKIGVGKDTVRGSIESVRGAAGPLAKCSLLDKFLKPVHVLRPCWSECSLDESSAFRITCANVRIALSAAGRVGIDIDNDRCRLAAPVGQLLGRHRPRTRFHDLEARDLREGPVALTVQRTF